MLDEIYNFLGQHEQLKIETQEQYDFANDLVSEVKSRAAQLEAKRKERTRPLDETKKLIMADFNEIIEPLVRFEEVVKKQMIDFLRAEQKRKDEEQARIDAAALAEAKKNNVSDVVVPIVNEEVRTVRTGGATSTLKDKWEVTILNPALVPLEYLSPDPKKIQAAVDKGVRNIPGTKIENVGSLAIRSRN